MTQVNVYKATAQAGKIIKKEMVKSKKWIMDSVAEIVVGHQDSQLKLSEENPKRLVSLEYFEVLKENVVFDKAGKVAKKESSNLDQSKDLSDDLKGKAPRKAAAKPAKPAAPEAPEAPEANDGGEGGEE